MNNGTSPAVQGLSLAAGTPRPTLQVHPDDVICARCVRAWSSHDPACIYARTPLAPDPDSAALAVYEWSHRCAVAAAELLQEAQRAALDDLIPVYRARVLPDITAALDAATTLRDRLSRRLAVLTNPPEVQS